MEWLINLGYFGLFLGTLLAGTIIPLSSDVVLIGILALGGNPWICLIIATIGNWLGGCTSYWLGWFGKWEWLEKWFNVKREKLEKQQKVIRKYGVWLVLLAWVPVFGGLCLIALGFYKVKPKIAMLTLLAVCFVRFLGWTLLYVHYAERFIQWISP